MFTFLTVRFRTLAPSDPLNACQERAQVPELVAKLLVAAERQEMPNRVKTTRACPLELTESDERDMLVQSTIAICSHQLQMAVRPRMDGPPPTPPRSTILGRRATCIAHWRPMTAVSASSTFTPCPHRGRELTAVGRNF